MRPVINPSGLESDANAVLRARVVSDLARVMAVVADAKLKFAIPSDTKKPT